MNVCSETILSRLLMPTLAPGALFIVMGSDAGGFIGWWPDLATINGKAPMGPAGFRQYCRTKAL